MSAYLSDLLTLATITLLFMATLAGWEWAALAYWRALDWLRGER